MYVDFIKWRKYIYQTEPGKLIVIWLVDKKIMIQRMREGTYHDRQYMFKVRKLVHENKYLGRMNKTEIKNLMWKVNTEKEFLGIGRKLFKNF